MSLDPIILPSFNCDKLEYRAYHLSLVRLAYTSERVPGGLLSQVLSPAAYLKTRVCISLGGEAFVPPTKPIKPIGAALTAASQANYDAEKVIFDNYVQDTGRFATALTNSLQQEAQDFVIEDNDDKELHELEIREIVGSLDDEFGASPRPTDITTLQAKLTVAYSPLTGSIEKFIAKHTKAHKELKAFNEEMTQHGKIAALEKALVPCNQYKGCIQHFKLTYPNLDDKNRNFLTFSKMVKDYEPDEYETLAKRQYTAASAVANNVSVDYAALLQQLITMQSQINALSSAPYGHAAAATALEPPTDYCWSHGHCWHSGLLCNKRKKGHVEAATLHDQQGGSKRVYPPRPPIMKKKN
jgi:hypothetical protein